MVISEAPLKSEAPQEERILPLVMLVQHVGEEPLVLAGLRFVPGGRETLHPVQLAQQTPGQRAIHRKVDGRQRCAMDW